MTILLTHQNEQVRLDSEVARLAETIDGRLLWPGGSEPSGDRPPAAGRAPAAYGYHDARRLWNGMIDRRPGLIARCRGVPDVQAVVRFAASNHLLLAVRGGGHNVAGTASNRGGVVVDLSEMNEVDVHPKGRRVRAQGGARWADVDAATQEHGLATPGGVVSDTGIGGLTLGGGIGWLRRKHGLSCDNLLGAELVDAEGQVRRVDAETDPDLLWGLRGGGGNFGVVTRFEYELHPVGPELFMAFVVYHADRTAEVLDAYRDYASGLAEEVSSFAICGTVPEEDDFPEESWGEPYVLLMACAASDPARGEQLVRPLRELEDPLADLSGVMPYVELQQVLDADYPAGLRYYWKSLQLPALSDEVIKLSSHWAAHRPSALSTLDLWHLGGAMGRVAENATAFGDRSAEWLLGVEANWSDPGADQENLDWTRGCIEAFREASTGREYLNFPGFFEDETSALRATYGKSIYDRLAALKRRVDPDNLFRLHQNVPPAE